MANYKFHVESVEVEQEMLTSKMFFLDVCPDINPAETNTKEELFDYIKKRYRKLSKEEIQERLNTLWFICYEMQIGDVIIVYSEDRKRSHFGTISSPYIHVHSRKDKRSHRRMVEWLSENVPHISVQ